MNVTINEFEATAREPRPSDAGAPSSPAEKPTKIEPKDLKPALNTLLKRSLRLRAY